MKLGFYNYQTNLKKGLAFLIVAFLSLGIFAISTAPAMATPGSPIVYVRVDGDDIICDGSVNVAVGAYVGTGQPCAIKTITIGIGLVATAGTINISAGTYTESPTIDKSLTLNGVGDTTIVDGAIETTGANVAIQNLKVTNANPDGPYDWGIKATAGKTLTLSTVTVDVMHNGVYMKSVDFTNTTTININNSDIKGYGAIELADPSSIYNDENAAITVNIYNTNLTGTTSYGAGTNDYQTIGMDYTNNVTINFTGTNSVANEYTGDATSRERLVWFWYSNNNSITGTPTYTNHASSTVNEDALFMSSNDDSNTMQGQVVARYVMDATELEAALASVSTTPIVVGADSGSIATTKDNTLKTGVTLRVEANSPVTIATGTTLTNTGNIQIEPGASLTNDGGTINGTGAIESCVNTEGTQGCFATIQGAIYEALDGYIIRVSAGEYIENITVDKELTLAGVSSATVTVTADDTGANVLAVEAYNVEISGLTVANGNAGIYLNGVTGANIHDNILTNNNYGIWLDYADNNTVMGNTADANSQYGIWLSSSDTNSLTSNSANNNGQIGYFLTDSTGNTLDTNSASLNGYGFRFQQFSGNNTVENNTANDNGDGFFVKNSSGNSFRYNSSTSNDGYGFYIKSGNSTTTTLTDNAITGNGTNAGNDGTGTFDATNNWWGTEVNAEIKPTISGDVKYISYYIDAGMTQLSTAVSEDGTATSSADHPQVVIVKVIDGNQPAVTITVEDGTPNPSIDVSDFITDGSGEIPQITVLSSLVDIYIPAGTIVTTSSDPAWNGIMEITVTSVVLPVTPGQINTLSMALEIGFPDAKLSFNKGIKLVLHGQKDKKVGYSRTGLAFTEITNICSANDQAAGDALPVDGDCKINSGNDLVVWTKHFSTFATYSSGGTGLNSTGIPNTGFKNRPVYIDFGIFIAGLIVVAGALRFTRNK